MTAEAQLADYAHKMFSQLRTNSAVVEATEFPELNASMTISKTLTGRWKVQKSIVYLNRAGRLQVSSYQQDFATRDEAETLYLEVLEMHGCLAFGDEIRISRGSGARFVAHQR